VTYDIVLQRFTPTSQGPTTPYPCAIKANSKWKLVRLKRLALERFRCPMLTRHKPESVQNGTPRNESRMSNLDTRAMSNPYFQVGRWDCTDELEGCQFSAPHTSVSVPNFEEIQTLHYTCVYEVAITCTQRHDMHNDEFAHVLSSVIELANRVDLTRLRQHHSIDNFATHVLTFRFILDLLRQTYQEYIKGSIENNSFEHVEFTFNNCMDGTHGMATCFKTE